MDDAKSAQRSGSRPRVKARLNLDVLDKAARARVEKVFVRTLEQELANAPGGVAMRLRTVTVGVIDDDESDED